MFKLKHKLPITMAPLFVVSILVFGLMLAPKVKAFTPDSNLPNCFTSSRTHTFCDSHYYGTDATVGSAARLQAGKCYVEDRGGPSGDLRGYSEVDCATADSPSSAAAGSSGLGGFTTGAHGKYVCGGVETTINFGCQGSDNPILQVLFAIVRFLSVGVGLVVIASLIVAGIQFSASQGNPQATAAAQKRIASTVGALILFMLMYALLNWLVPGGLFI